MNASNATATDPSNLLEFPVAIFAAVWGLRFGSTTPEQPILQFDFGRTVGLLLVRLAPGEFGLILAGRFYNTTLLATRISPDWLVAVDNNLLELRWLPHTYEARASNTWMHIRFNDRVVFADFNRRFWECFWEAEEHVNVLQQRLRLVASASPSNFMRYCRQYLGEDYFDDLSESNDESEEEESAGHYESEVEVANALDAN